MKHLTKPEKIPNDIVVNQNIAISQAIYTLSVNARRLIAYAMSKMSFDGGGPYQVTFTYQEFTQALGLGRGTGMRELILEAIQECLNSHIELTYWENGMHVWQGLVWFTESKLISHIGIGDLKTTKTVTPETEKLPLLCDTILMEFNPKLGATLLKEFQHAYSRIKLADLGKLQSRYSYRIYEYAMSYSGFAGKEGNKPDEWFCPPKPLTTQELRRFLDVKKMRYKRTAEFRRNCLDAPCQEIRNACIGIDITPKPFKAGKYITGFQFRCKFTPRNERNITPVSSDPEADAEQDAKDQALIGTHPEEYQKLYDFELKQLVLPGLPFNQIGLEEAAKLSALKLLREKYPNTDKKTRKREK